MFLHKELFINYADIGAFYTSPRQRWYVDYSLKPQAESLLFAVVLLLLQPIQIEEVDRVLQSVGLTFYAISK